MTKILLDVMYEDLQVLLEDFGWIVETVSKHIGVTQKDRDDGKVLQYAKENVIVVVADDKKFINRLKVNMVSVVTADTVDKVRVIREKVGNSLTSV